MTDITEHRTREGKLFCCVVLDTFCRRVVGWAIDSRAGGDLATNALSLAINAREAQAGAVIHGDHGPQFTSWPFTHRARQAGLLPSLGSVDDPWGNAVIESFWGGMQVELLNRQRWNTRIELANATFKYIEGVHNTRRRHSCLNWKTPLDFEQRHRAVGQVSLLASPWNRVRISPDYRVKLNTTTHTAVIEALTSARPTRNNDSMGYNDVIQKCLQTSRLLGRE